MLQEIPPIPEDLLNGATLLYVHPTLINVANRINEAAGGRLLIQTGRYALPKIITAFKGDECVAVMKIDKDVTIIENRGVKDE